ncbi:nuclear envelope integral membrane protein 2 isoform X2 [Myotis daubentonii]|uniref:nuclear envelope integral membrane protein 2 isoform X2 n=1 Tax=Myotis daubentonii TaxID=98922 RepID=UPI002873765D|nr:nuclear envelope integral membrane protein 2 isoform X2 [Myotis daubentonii]
MGLRHRREDLHRQPPRGPPQPAPRPAPGEEDPEPRGPEAGPPPGRRGLAFPRGGPAPPSPSRPRAAWAAGGGMRPRAGPWWLLLWAPLAAGLGRAKEARGAPLAVPRCRALKEMDLIKNSESDCYCYHQKTQIEWKYIWSTVQVRLTSADLLSVAYITERHNCQDPETVLSLTKCAIHAFWTPSESHEISVSIRPHAETVCFSVKPAGRHTVQVTRRVVDFGLVLLFVAGIVLFRLAARLSQSPAFYYSLGTALGVLMAPVFLLLLARRCIRKCSTFGAVMVACWFASVYVVCQWMENLPWLWGEHRMYVVGYVLTVGCLSFAACYRRGPLVKERSQRLLAWTLRLLALALTCSGAPMPQVAWTTVGLMLLTRGLHYSGRALRNVRKWLRSRRLAVKYLTEEQYREQAAAETTRALEELRQACRRPDFPSWLVMSRLHAPKKFADFVLGGSHLSPEEMRLHEEYSLGGAFLEEQLFNLGQRPRPECPAPAPCPLPPPPAPALALPPAPAPTPAPDLALTLPPLPCPAPALSPPSALAPAPACHSGPRRV